MSVAAYIILMAGVTYVIRMIPFTFFRKKIESKYVRSFLKYIPYAVLSAMTIPEIFKSTGNVATSVVGTIVAAVLAFFWLMWPSIKNSINDQWNDISTNDKSKQDPSLNTIQNYVFEVR